MNPTTNANASRFVLEYFASSYYGWVEIATYADEDTALDRAERLLSDGVGVRVRREVADAI